MFKAIKSALEYLFNCTLAICLLILFSPIFLWIAIRLKLQGTKDIIYKQIRVGKDGKYFTIYKFRTMVADANKDGPFICTTYTNPKITPYGSFLRRKKLDELPQLINIIKGDMNFVGPRPEIPHFHEENLKQVNDWEIRISVKPGVTGLAQIHPTISHDPHEKITEDVSYVNQKSFFFDILVMFRTAQAWLGGARL